MTKTPEQNTEASQSAPLDLSELQNLDFTSNWGDSPRKPRADRSSGHSARRPQGRHAGAKDRRPGGGGPRRGGDRRTDHRSVAPVQPFQSIVEALFYPEDAPFTALVNALRTSCKTYQLFEIAQLILEKPERFVIVINPKAGNKDGVDKFFCSVPDHMPFLTEQEAIAHVMRAYIDTFFDTELVEVEPPKGNFPFVNRCKRTGEVLGPPNFHRYQQLVQEHFALHGSDMSFESFERQLERVEDPEVVQSWVDGMGQVRNYRLKNQKEGDPEVFESLESARFFLTTHRKDKLVREVKTARFPGSALEGMPRGTLRRSIETEFEHQRKFPLQTSNNLRGRLRRLKFNLFKKGAKGPAYVCAVKRRFRDETTVFAESLQALVTFIEKHPDILVSELQTKYLNFPQPVKPAEGEEATPAPVLTPEQRAQSKQLIQDLRWLIVEGYVTEFSDGKLYAPPVREAQPEKPEVAPTPEVEEVALSPEASTPDAAPEAKVEAEAPVSDEPAPEKPEAPLEVAAQPEVEAEPETVTPKEEV